MVYNRQKAVEYAEKWALKRNPAYYNFDKIGGDCTNFVSQCIFAGSGKMNYEKIFGWYYTDINNRSPAWTGVGFLYKFLLNNTSSGPYAQACDVDALELGDVVQLDYGSGYQHSALVTSKNSSDILLSAHTADCCNKPLSQFPYENIRAMHIMAVRI